MPENLTFRNTATGAAYVGSTACAACHRDIYDRYRKTDMGDSMCLGSEPSQLDRVKEPVAVFHQQFNRHYEMFRRGDSLFQSEYELDQAGKEVFRNTYKILYVMGSAANGQNYIIRRGNYLFEAPLAFCAKAKKWDLSPGYETDDYGFRRPVRPGCIMCHSGGPEPVSGRNDGLSRDPPFRELAIGCENCHGPGDLHVRERAAGKVLRGDVDSSIVNPARLPGWLADNICMDCHERGDSRVLQPGKDYSDFRPGTPLSDTVVILRARYLALLDQVAKTEPNNTFVLSAVARKLIAQNTPETDLAAIDHLSRAIRLGSTAVEDYENLAQLLGRAGRVGEAITVLQNGIALWPYTPVFYRLLVQAYLSQKRYAEAGNAMQRDLELFPEDSTMRMLFGKFRGMAANP